MEKILIFENNDSKNYWFKYIVRKLSNDLNGRYILYKVYYHSKEIWSNGNRIIFLTLKQNIEDKGRSDKFTRYYYFMENKLENNFKETLEEILL